MWYTPLFRSLYPYVIDVLDNASPKDFVVFDIDDTVLHGMGDVTPSINGLSLVEAAHVRNLGVYYVTARPETPTNRQQTYADLASVGIVDPSMVVMRPPAITSWYDVGKFKQESRDMIQRVHGGKCVLTVGDRWTDMFPITEEKMRDIERTIGNVYSLFQLFDESGWGLKLKES
jgi:predicted secreted acid phosphatase